MKTLHPGRNTGLSARLPFLATLLFAQFLATGVLAQSANPGLDDWLRQHARDMGGRVILVICKDGKMVYSHSISDMTAGQKMAARFIARRQGRDAYLGDYGPDTRLPVASCSKWFSAALAMSFVDEGKLRLTDTVGQYLPVLSQHGKGDITIAQCLSHLTGIKAPPLKESLEETRNEHTMDEAIADIAAMPMEGKAGKVFHYSNIGLQIVGAVLEKIGGKSFESLFAERITVPLGMHDTDFGKGPVALPAGGAWSTPNDYLVFLDMILNKGMHNGQRILSEQSIAAMQVNRIDPSVTIAYSPAGGADFGYGFGEWTFGRTDQGQPANAVTSPGLFGSFPWLDNQRHYCAFLMAFYLNNKGRNERYVELKQLVDKTIAGQ